MPPPTQRLHFWRVAFTAPTPQPPQLNLVPMSTDDEPAPKSIVRFVESCIRPPLVIANFPHPMALIWRHGPGALTSPFTTPSLAVLANRQLGARVIVDRAISVRATNTVTPPTTLPSDTKNPKRLISGANSPRPRTRT